MPAAAASTTASERVGFVVARAVGAVVQVVELADAGDARVQHLAEACLRSGTDAVGVERSRGLVHRGAPAPEVVVVAAALVGCAADRALERVAVGVDQARQYHRAPEVADHRGQRHGLQLELASRCHDDAGVVDVVAHTREHAAVDHAVIGQEAAARDHGVIQIFCVS
ncbi:MAG: hypothetical protein U0168_02675 [Nannocystaceae bacterium]